MARKDGRAAGGGQRLYDFGGERDGPNRLMHRVAAADHRRRDRNRDIRLSVCHVAAFRPLCSDAVDLLLGGIRSVGADWIGLHRIYDWILALPVVIFFYA